MTMTILQIEHKVPGYADWKKAFDSDPVGRKKFNVKRYQIFRPTDDPDYVIIHLHFESTEDASKMLASLNILWGKVEGTIMIGPKARILDIVESMDL
jgi:hypothetical protein